MNPLLAFANPGQFNIWESHPSLVIGFAITVVIMLALDLGVFNKNSHVVSSKEALAWSVVWISLAMVFSGVVYYLFSHTEGEGDAMALEAFSQFQAAYWIEKALSVDNLFVFILVFTAFKVPKALHHKVLFWGIIGALVFRAIFIFAGVGIINATYLPEMNVFGQDVQINVVLAIFGFFLLYSGIKSWGAHNDDEEEPDFTNNTAVKLVNKFYKISPNYDGDKFFTIQNGIKMATPLFVAVVVIEFTDLIFAVDSIPAIFAISQDPFILYTSNIFAILGLRSLYFLLANFMHMFSKLPYGLAIVLSFIGVKMIIMPWFHFPSTVSLGIVGGILLLSVIASLIWPGEKKENTEKTHDSIDTDNH